MDIHLNQIHEKPNFEDKRSGYTPIRLARGFFFFLAALSLLFLPPTFAQNNAAGIFSTRCAECHGADGSGHTPKGEAGKIPDLHSVEVQKQSDVQLADIITNGKRSSRGLNYSMPSNKGKLTDNQIKQLVAYIRGLAKK
jgi:mono/diheme cytochrome c family protein